MKNLNNFLNEALTNRQRPFIVNKSSYPVLYGEILNRTFIDRITDNKFEKDFEDLCDWLIKIDKKQVATSVVEQMIETIIAHINGKLSKTEENDIVKYTSEFIAGYRDYRKVTYQNLNSPIYLNMNLAVFRKESFLMVLDKVKQEHPNTYVDNPINITYNRLSEYFGDYEENWPDLRKSFNKLIDFLKH